MSARTASQPDGPRRRWCAATALLLLLGAALLARPSRAWADAAHPTVYVLLQLDAKVAVVEKTLADHLPGLTVKVFATYRDFDSAVTGGNPDAVVVIPPVLEARGKKATLQGMRAGKDWEPWVLVSVDKPLDGSLAGKTIGMVDLLGRDGTQAFIGKVVKDKDFKVKRVAKVEDLVSLLEFSAAQALLVPSSTLAALAKHTRLSLKTRELPEGHVGLPAVAVLNPAANDAVVKAFNGLDAATKAVLGIDAWSPR
jgi:ABC-type amino acid transport substrate-binding protein